MQLENRLHRKQDSEI